MIYKFDRIFTYFSYGKNIFLLVSSMFRLQCFILPKIKRLQGLLTFDFLARILCNRKPIVRFSIMFGRQITPNIVASKVIKYKLCIWTPTRAATDHTRSLNMFICTSKTQSGNSQPKLPSKITTTEQEKLQLSCKKLAPNCREVCLIASKNHTIM